MSASYNHPNAPHMSGAADSSPVNELQKYFGPLRNKDVEAWAQDQFSHETHNLPKAYEGRNKFLMATIDFLITKDDDWYTRAILPWEFTEELHVAWNIWRFNKTMMDYEPHQGVPRYITQEGESHEASLSRRGLAFIIEHGFWKTELGKSHYLMNLRQIVEAVHETVYYGVIHALLGADNHYEMWNRRHGVLHHSTLETVLQDDKSNWAIVQKDVKGLYVLDAEVKDRMRRQGIEPNAWIFPPKMAIYASMVPEYMTEFQRRGETAKNSLETGAAMFNSFRGLPVYETRQFDVDFQGDGIEPLTQHAQCGEYYAFDEALDVEHGFKIFDMRQDKFVTVDIVGAIENLVNYNAQTDLNIVADVAQAWGGNPGPGMDVCRAHFNSIREGYHRHNGGDPGVGLTDAQFAALRDATARAGAGEFNESLRDGTNMTADQAARVPAWPVQIVLAKPWMTYRMSSALCVRGGDTLGQTFHGHHDFQLTDDVIHKVHIGHYTFYSKSIVKNPKQMYIARNVYCQGYEYGDDTRFVRTGPGAPDINSQIPSGEHARRSDIRSMISLAIQFNPQDLNTRRLQNPLCLQSEGLGNTMPSVDIHDENDGRVPQVGRDGLRASRQVAAANQFNSLPDELAFYFNNDEAHDGGELRNVNHIVWRGCKKGFQPNPEGGVGSYTRVEINTGHWGPNVYDGVGAVRRGQYANMRECNYQSC